MRDTIEKRANRRVEREYRKIYDQAEVERLEAFERKKADKQKRRRIKRRRKLIAIMMVVLTVLYFLTPLARVQSIVVYNNKQMTNDEVKQNAHLVEGQSFNLLHPSFLVSYQLERNPFIESADVKRQGLTQVNITIKEKRIVFKTQIDNKWWAYFGDGTKSEIPEELHVDTAVLLPVEVPETFKYVELAQKLGRVQVPEVVDAISEIKHAPSNLEEDRFIFYMEDRNRIIILMNKIDTKLQWYFKLVELSNGERLEFVMEYANRGVIGRKI